MKLLELVNDFLHTGQFLSLVQLFLGLALLVVIMIMTAHTLSVLGRKTFLYRKRPAADGWSKRFYPAATLMMLLIGASLWCLQLLK